MCTEDLIPDILWYRYINDENVGLAFFNHMKKENPKIASLIHNPESEKPKK